MPENKKLRENLEISLVNNFHKLKITKYGLALAAMGKLGGQNNQDKQKDPVFYLIWKNSKRLLSNANKLEISPKVYT